MTRVLSLDTTTEFGSLALLRDGELLEELPLRSPGGFGHILFDHLRALLARHGWELGQVDCFAAAAGPGSFTGVRVSLATVKGLAEAEGKPVAAISTLRAAAWFGSLPLRAVLLDARRGEIYGGLYDDRLEPAGPETVSRFGDWIAALPEREIEFLSTDPDLFRPALAATRFASARLTGIPRALAGAVGRIAERDLAAGRLLDPADAGANYVRRSDAELFWKDRNG